MHPAEPSLVDKVLALHDALDTAGLQHAFGGALALAYYTHDPRATADVDVNVSVPASRAQMVFDALPTGVLWTADDLERSSRDEQVRLWWDRTPVDLFFRAAPFHDGVAERSVTHQFASRSLPFVAADDLAVFKSLFSRPKDWLDIESMHAAGSIDVDVVTRAVQSLIGNGETVDRLLSILAGS